MCNMSRRDAPPPPLMATQRKKQWSPPFQQKVQCPCISGTPLGVLSLIKSRQKPYREQSTKLLQWMLGNRAELRNHPLPERSDLRCNHAVSPRGLAKPASYRMPGEETFMLGLHNPTKHPTQTKVEILHLTQPNASAAAGSLFLRLEF